MRCWTAAIRVLIDTHALLLAYTGLLPRKVQEAIGGPENEWLLSTASLAEMAVKTAIGKLDMPQEETQRAVRELQVTVLPLEPHHALRMFSLPLHHRDPFDRMILATALSEGLPVVTRDRIFRRYSGVKVIW